MVQAAFVCFTSQEAVFNATGLSQLKAYHKIGHEIPSPTWGENEVAWRNTSVVPFLITAEA